MQYGKEVKRVVTPPLPIPLDKLLEKIISTFGDTLTADMVPLKALYIQDAQTKIFYQLDDQNDVIKGNHGFNDPLLLFEITFSIFRFLSSLFYSIHLTDNIPVLSRISLKAPRGAGHKERRPGKLAVTGRPEQLVQLLSVIRGRVRYTAHRRQCSYQTC